MPTKKFAWKDRDNAALDLIQLVYHAPEPVSLQALHILSAIRSLSIVSDLKDIVLDSGNGVWERIYALRAIKKSPAKFIFPNFLQSLTTIWQHANGLSRHIQRCFME